MYQVVIRKAAQKNLAKIDKRYRIRINLTLIELAKDPYLGKKLEGELRNSYSLRVWPYRIIYQILKNELIIFVIQIKHRQGVYNFLR